MAVGAELEKTIGLKLFHNHMSIKFVQPFFNYSTATGKKMVGEFRCRIFEEVAKSDSKGLIFSYVWAFNLPSFRESLHRLRLRTFQKSRGSRVFR